MSLFQVASHRPLVINSVTARDAIQDELIVVATLRLIADNRYEQASGQLRNLVKGPLNSSIIRVHADIAVLVQKETIVLLSRTLYGFDQFMRGLDYKKGLKS